MLLPSPRPAVVVRERKEMAPLSSFLGFVFFWWLAAVMFCSFFRPALVARGGGVRRGDAKIGQMVGRKTLLPPCRYDLLLLFFFFLGADAGGSSWFARADGPAAVLDRSVDSSSLPSGRDTFRGTQNQR